MAIFGVKYRLALINKDFRPYLHSFLSKIVEEHGKGSHAICIGGTQDHVHILFSLSSNIALSDLIREIKSRSSRWINENHHTVGRFEWQRGYGAFSYSQSAIVNVVKYVENQEEHHRHRSFREEFEEFLKKYDLVSDPRDLPQDPI